MVVVCDAGFTAENRTETVLSLYVCNKWIQISGEIIQSVQSDDTDIHRAKIPTFTSSQKDEKWLRALSFRD